MNQRIRQTVDDNSWLSYPTGAPGTTSYTANTLNQYSAVTGLAPTYDANGNLTGDGTFTFGYDAESRLTSASGAGNSATYAFDAQGRRKARTVNGTTTISVTDADNREVLEYDGSGGALLRWYAYGLGPNDVLNQMSLAPSGRVTFVPDLLGSVIAAFDASGALTKSAYQPYGGSAAAASPFAFTGQRIDQETGGTYYYRARQYSTVLGRFLQPDPVRYAAGANLYTYVSNNPLNAVDASGLAADVPSNGGGYGGAWSPSSDLGAGPGFGSSTPSILPDVGPTASPSIGQTSALGSALPPLAIPTVLPGSGPVGSAGIPPTSASTTPAINIPASPQNSVDVRVDLGTGLPPSSDNVYEVANKQRGPTLNCQNVLCGSPTGGVVYPLCPTCNDRLKNGGPPILLENGQKIYRPIEPED